MFIPITMRRFHPQNALHESFPAKAVVLLLVATVSVLACTGAVSSSEDIKTLPVRILYESTHCRGLDGEPGLVRITADGQPLSGLFSTDVDFASEEMIIVNMGQQRTGGYRVALHANSATVADRLVRISLLWIQPSADDIVTQALTHPCIILALPRGDYVRVEIIDQYGKQRMATGTKP